MSDAARVVDSPQLEMLDEELLRDHVVQQRWFASKAREVTQVNVLDAVPLRREPPLLVIALVETRFQPGTHEIYQLLLGFRPSDEDWTEQVLDKIDGWTVYEALRDEVQARTLLHQIRSRSVVRSEESQVEFHGAETAVDGGDSIGDAAPSVRPMGAEQSNTSVVFGERAALKLYRRIEAGPNPELELMRFLADRGFPHVPRLLGWFTYSGRLVEATLGLLQEFLPDGRDGWELALEELSLDPDRFLGRLGRLGEVTGSLHATLGSHSLDPAFAPEEPSVEALSLLTATIDEEIGRIFVDLPEDEAVEPIAGRGEEVRDRLQMLAQIGTAGRLIRTHGDYHLGQTMLTSDDWVLLDFEGEPARSLPERRRKRSPLRDVAGMLRSFAYVASASEIVHGASPPPEWEAHARSAFLEGYYSTVDPSLLPASEPATERLLSVYELEKAVYELRYELNNRPDWVRIPVAGIVRLLDMPTD